MHIKLFSQFLAACFFTGITLAACQSESNENKPENFSAKTVAFITATEIVFTDSTTHPFPKMNVEDSMTTFFIVRHAEKDTGDNPRLHPLGERRANELVKIFKNAGITHAFTSPYRRTLLTAKPLVTKLDLPMGSFDPRTPQEAAFYYLSKARGGKVFISGHSNTNPQLVNHFMGKEALPQIPDEQYDDIYVVFVPKNGQAQYWALKYQKSFADN